MALDPRNRKKIIRMYQEGARVAEITEATGASRGTIYFVLHDEGLTPNRQGVVAERATLLDEGEPPQTDSALLNWALRRVTALERDNGALRERMRLAREGLLDV